MTTTVHQALHGYSDGHRLISSSLPLSGHDARVLVVMSDLSGPGVKPDPSGYITGYPLDGVGKYVLARTWAAPEMSRPGCVWTHSLIIDNADLATLTSADGLLSAFRRPNGLSGKSEYMEPAAILDHPAAAPRFPSLRARSILAALYLAPGQSVVAEADEAKEDERLVTAIWMQQWPRLRRAFGFCTLAGMDRSQKGVRLDLNFIRSADRHALAKFSDYVSPLDVMEDPALWPLTADLEGRDSTKIREFLRRSGGDVDGGRRAMLPLCQLHSSLFGTSQPDLQSAVVALGKLDSLGTRQARSVRVLIARKAIEIVDEIDDKVFDFVVDTLEQGASVENDPLAVDRLGMALWHRSPVRFVKAMSTNGVLGRVSEEALATIKAADLVDGLRKNPELAECLVSARPDLLERSDFWKISDLDDRLISKIDESAAGRAAAALLISGRVGPAPLITSRANPSELAAALNHASSKPVLDGWLKTLSHDLNKTAAVLATGQIKHRSIVASLARVCDPDSVPNDYGDDPWLTSLQTACDHSEQSEEDYLAAFVMSRALGNRSRSQAELIRFAYTTLHFAFQKSRLTWDAERLVTSRLNWGAWFAWDNCSRLRETVVNRFVEQNLDPIVFGGLTEDRLLAAGLIDEAARSRLGRRYLRQVYKSLKGYGRAAKWRLDYISSKIR